jgi:hypothetical protein
VKELVLPDLQDTDVTSEAFGGRAKVLKDLILHHAEEEEEELFPRARKLLGKERLEELGGEMEARKSELTIDLSSVSSAADRRHARSGAQARA